MPGNPVDMWIVGQIMRGMDPERAYEIASYVFQFDVETPLYLQYITYMSNILQGNLGKSMLTHTPVINILIYALPWTLFTTSIAVVTSFAVGILGGMYIAYKRGTTLDKVLFSIGSFSSVIPNYLIALLFLNVFAIYSGIFPLSGAYDFNIKPGFTLEFIISIFYHAALPILAFVITSFGGWLLSMRGSTISVLGEDYVAAAEARGLKNRRITMSYVGRNAILPLFTSVAISIGYLVGGSIFIESTFSYPGIGVRMAKAIGSRDYPIVLGCFLLLSFAVILSNFLADTLYAKLDPRIRKRGD
jgi:peptide/nickel transport system permease protein